MRELRARHTAQADKRGEAVKTFYAALSPEQQKTFDAEFHRQGPGKHRVGATTAACTATTTAPMATAARPRRPRTLIWRIPTLGAIPASSPQTRIAGFFMVLAAACG